MISYPALINMIYFICAREQRLFTARMIARVSMYVCETTFNSRIISGLLRWRLRYGVAKRFPCPRPRPGHWRHSCLPQAPLTRETHPSHGSTSTSAKTCLSLSGSGGPYDAVLGALASGGDSKKRQPRACLRALLAQTPPPLLTRASRSTRTLARRLCRCRSVAARSLRVWHPLMTIPEIP